MSAYLVAEVGQNHQGSIEVAKDIVRICAQPKRGDLYGGEMDMGGVDAVKFTRRDLQWELTDAAAYARYSGPHAFGSTYGKHRERLELDVLEHLELYRYAKSEFGLGFVETLCAPSLVGETLALFTPDYLKVASRDIDNDVLLHELARAGIPMILSTGMATPTDLDRALEVVTGYHDRVTILHCVSTYPTPPEEVNLLTLDWLREKYPYPVGYSCHCMGYWAAYAAAAMGATVVEKHVTIDRTMRGGDHMGALDRDGVWRWVRDTRLMERARGAPGMYVPESVGAAQSKLGRSVATRRPLPAGWRITATDVVPLSPRTGVPWHERERVVGKTLVHEVPERAALTATMVSG